MKALSGTLAAFATALGSIASCGGGTVTGADSGGPEALDATASSSGSGIAHCGAASESCCNGTACNAGLVCGTAGTCIAAGGGSSSSSGGPASSSGSGSGTSSGSGSGSGASSGSSSGGGTSGPCAAGAYTGPFAGEYTSHLTAIGVPVPVQGNVSLMLMQVGAPTQTCIVEGEAVSCASVFAIDGGTISGTFSGRSTDGGAVSGFPFFCSMTGALDCQSGTLDDGWLQCTYCVGPLADGGMGCASAGGSTAVGGRFAGPMTARYAPDAGGFVNGQWNGSEALAGYSSPGPDGGLSAYLSDSGLYLGPGQFGGSGTWSATRP